jgi:hypothetical protein
MFILVLFYRYDRVIASLWIRYPRILLGEGLQLTSIGLQIILWLRNANSKIWKIKLIGIRTLSTSDVAYFWERLTLLYLVYPHRLKSHHMLTMA